MIKPGAILRRQRPPDDRLPLSRSDDMAALVHVIRRAESRNLAETPIASDRDRPRQPWTRRYRTA